MCGEHHMATHDCNATRGSSPRVRGTRPTRRLFWRYYGIIPACAGNTPPSTARRWFRRDHPRVCGEHEEDEYLIMRELGSSPRVRGTLHNVGRGLGVDGIIPACAGNTPVDDDGYTVDGDHPRVCGEHCVNGMRSPSNRGSSPRVRGTPLCNLTSLLKCGIIPACAGNTYDAGGRFRSCRDHPRVCGEH